MSEWEKEDHKKTKLPVESVVSDVGKSANSQTKSTPGSLH